MTAIELTSTIHSNQYFWFQRMDCKYTKSTLLSDNPSNSPQKAGLFPKTHNLYERLRAGSSFVSTLALSVLYSTTTA